MEADGNEKPQENVVRVSGKPVMGTALTGMVMSALGDHGIPCWRQQAGVTQGFSGSIVRLGINGCADICAILPDGKMLQVEVKAGKDRQSDDQKRFQAMIERNNGIYLIARSVDDVNNFAVQYKSGLHSQ